MDEKPPFLTWQEIERKAALLPEDQQPVLWAVSYTHLTLPTIYSV